MNKSIESLTPCQDWFYVADDGTGKVIVFRVAAWALQIDGQVVGLISASSAKTPDNVARLVAPPPIGGMYLHRDSLSESQVKQANEGAKPQAFQ